jgi:hypothetical protein
VDGALRTGVADVRVLVGEAGETEGNESRENVGRGGVEERFDAAVTRSGESVEVVCEGRRDQDKKRKERNSTDFDDE